MITHYQAAIAINGLVSIISIMGIVVAASELPLLRKQQTLTDEAGLLIIVGPICYREMERVSH